MLNAETQKRKVFILEKAEYREKGYFVHFAFSRKKNLCAFASLRL